MGLVVTGCGILFSTGVRLEALATALSKGCDQAPVRAPNVGDLYSEKLPSHTGHALVGFDVRKHLGRKGTTFLDRSTGLALVATGQAIDDGHLKVDDENRHLIGVALGTTAGSLKSMSNFTQETLNECRPYLVNPALFPNTVMNCAAGQIAIRYGLKGVNATIAGGELAFLGVLRYATTALRCGYADVLIAGAVEEFTPHRAWATHLADLANSTVTAGEGAAMFVVESTESALRSRRHVDAELLSVITGFSPGGEKGRGMTDALEGCIRRALVTADVNPGDVSLVASGESGDPDRDQVEADALGTVLRDAQVERVLVKRIVGECHAASGGLQLAAMLALHRDDSDRNGRLSLVTSWTRDGGVGAAVLRGWSRVGSHHR